MRFPWLNKLKMRTKVTVIAVLVVLLAGASVFTALYSIGKLGTRADTNTKTVVVSGKMVDPSTNKPVKDANIILQTRGHNFVKAKTDSNGYYKISITSESSIVNLSYFIPGGLFTTDNTRDLIIPDDSSKLSITSNLNIWTALASSTTSSNQTTSAIPNGPCAEAQKTFPSQDLYSQDINAVKFCTLSSEKDLFFPTHINDLTTIANQVIRLRSITGLSDAPKFVFLLSTLTDKTGPHVNGGQIAGLTVPSDNSIFLAEVGTRKLKTITHEFGHLVDWNGGKISDDKIFCAAVLSGEKHCFSSDGTFQGPADDLMKSNAIIGYPNITSQRGMIYAENSPAELFAELFAAMFVPDEGTTDQYGSRERFQYAIKNYLFFPSDTYDYNKLTISTRMQFNIATKGNGDDAKSSVNVTQNDLMYLYKWVANKSRIDEYFPGKIIDDYESYNVTETDFSAGAYMNTGVVSIKLNDHTGTPMEATNVIIGSPITTPGKTTINSQTLVTRLKKGKNVFSDGAGDLFDTTGTTVNMDIAVGTKKPIYVPNPPDYYKGAVFNPVKKDIIVQGSNPVIDLSYSAMTFAVTNTDGSSPVGTSGNIKFDVSKLTALGIKKGQMTRYPTLGTTSGAIDKIGDRITMIVGGDIGAASTSTFSGRGIVIRKPNPMPARGVTIKPGYRCIDTANGLPNMPQMTCAKL